MPARKAGYPLSAKAPSIGIMRRANTWNITSSQGPDAQLATFWMSLDTNTELPRTSTPRIRWSQLCSLGYVGATGREASASTTGPCGVVTTCTAPLASSAKVQVPGNARSKRPFELGEENVKTQPWNSSCTAPSLTAIKLLGSELPGALWGIGAGADNVAVESVEPDAFGSCSPVGAGARLQPHNATAHAKAPLVTQVPRPTVTKASDTPQILG